MKKRIISLILIMVLAVGFMPTLSLAATSGDFAGGSGTVADPYLISNTTQLNNVRNDLDACYKLTNDIVFTDADFAEGGEFYNDGAGWGPIKYFKGILDGSGYVIKNLYINIQGSTDFVTAGLFGSTFYSAEVKNLGMENVDIYASSSSGSVYAGAILGRSSESSYSSIYIQNCYATGNITVLSQSSYVHAGGIVGNYDNVHISNCYNAADISATSYSNSTYVGGIVGDVDDYYAIESCYNTGDISGVSNTSSVYAGGIAGNSSADVTNCYNTGNVSATAPSGSGYAGGICGYSKSDDITDCYNVGYVLSTSKTVYAGGIAGYGGSDYITDCYYLDNVSAATGNSVSDIFATKCTDEQMQLQATYSNFDFENVWGFDSNVHSYPVLKNIHYYHVFDNDCDTSCNDCSYTRTTEHKYKFEYNSTEHYKKCSSCDNVVDAAAHFYDNACDGTCNGCLYTRDFEHSWGEYIFNNDDTITENGTETRTCSVCGTTETRTVAGTKGYFAGGSGTESDPYLIERKRHLDNVRYYLNAYYKLTNDIEFTEEDFAEGGAFYNGGEGWKPIGIFRGTFDGNGHIIKNLYINKQTETDYIYVGLFSTVYGTVKNLGMVNTDITAHSASGSVKAGAIAGDLYYSAKIENCYNTGNITATSQATEVYAGGIAGDARTGDISNCYNLGDVSATSYSNDCYAGGITGYVIGVVSGCYNQGDITANSTTSYSRAGGIAGFSSDEMVNCYNNGTVLAKSASYDASYAGGIVGYNLSDEIVDCYNTGVVAAENSYKNTYAYAGGIAGYSSNDKITDCYYINTNSDAVGMSSYNIIATRCTKTQMQNASTYVGFDFENIWSIDSSVYPYPVIKTINYALHSHTFDNDCDTLCNGCGYMRAPSHSTAADYDSNGHFDKCSVCGHIMNRVDHIYTDVCDTTCNDCDYTRTAPHSYVQRYDNYEHYDKCTLCRIEANYGTHKFDNSCDTVCNGCDYTRSVTHSFTNDYDNNAHFEKCTVCGQTQNVNNHIFDNDCDTSCNSCEFTRTTQHTYTNSCDDTCNVCGENRSVSHSYIVKYNADGHFEKCTVCGNEINRADHSYDNVCDSVCNGCDYTREAPHSYVTRYDNYEHYGKCSLCRIETNIEEHYFDNSCDSSCNGCSYTRTASHSWGEYVYNHDATTEADGTMTRTCSVCGATETITAAATLPLFPTADFPR